VWSSLPASLHDIAAARSAVQKLMHGAPGYQPGRAIEIRDLVLADAQHPVRLRIYSPPRNSGSVPGVLYMHGGGFISGDVDLFDADCLRLADRINVVVASVDYRLAPEHRYPTPLEDCYASLCWLASVARSLGIDPERLAVSGESSGAGLAAAVALLARDRQGPSLCLQSLSVPQIDDRLDSLSMTTFAGGPNWNRADAEASWNHYLGSHIRGTKSTSIYAAPARAPDLSGLPSAFVAVRQLDPLRDEGFLYAQRLIQAGISTELRHYPNAHHGSHLRASSIRDRMNDEREAALRHKLWPVSAIDGMDAREEGVSA
jgi:acetyl esterase